jgi:hypothetical protein
MGVRVPLRSLSSPLLGNGMTLPRRAGAATEAELFPIANTAYGKVRDVDHSGVCLSRL